MYSLVDIRAPDIHSCLCSNLVDVEIIHSAAIVFSEVDGFALANGAPKEIA